MAKKISTAKEVNSNDAKEAERPEITDDSEEVIKIAKDELDAWFTDIRNKVKEHSQKLVEVHHKELTGGVATLVRRKYAEKLSYFLLRMTPKNIQDDARRGAELRRKSRQKKE